MTPVTQATLWSAFGRIGIYSFGGPAAQIAVMNRVLVDETRWLTERQFLNGLSFCMMLPGPEAMQLATYAGWRVSGWRGGLLAGGLFVLPGALVMLALAWTYAAFGTLPLVEALFLGIKAAVLVIVLQALGRVARKALDTTAHWALAVAAFVGLFFLQLPYPLIVAGAALVGLWLGKDGTEATRSKGGDPRQTALLVAAGLAVWILPLLLLPGILGEIGLFFAKLAAISFGGAYALLAWMAQDAVGSLGWLSPGEMMDGLGLAETTPGPLILVTQFVGFIAAFRDGGWLLGLAGAAVTLYATFVPCFLWIFAGAPYIERISASSRLSGALSGITAAVVGVIANLSIWFALHVAFAEVALVDHGPIGLWTPDVSTLDWRVLLLALCAAAALFRLRLGLFLVLAAAAAGGLGLSTL